MTDNEQPEDLIRYDVLTQDALRLVIKKVLEEVSTSGLPGEHHFFITFRTDHPGVRLSSRMRERYNDEMTIVVQHSFWDLKVTETAFEIDLSFDDILERLRVPFAALKGFFDPHVKFGVQFDAETIELANDDYEDADQTAMNSSNEQPELKKPAKAEDTEAPDPAPEDDEKSDTEEEDSGEGNVVSLDQFRKKQ